MVRYKIIIEYNGTAFNGWQLQKEGLLTVQLIIERAIYQLTKQSVRVYGSGRTDKGVHAIGQVAHFDLERSYNQDKLAYAINHFMKPYPVVIKECKIVDSEFHARFSAIRRHYIYKIVNREAPLVLDNNLAYLVREKLCINSMQEAALVLIGKHDFSSFRASSCQARNPVRIMQDLSIEAEGEKINIFLAANAFLHHMVRIIVANLVLIGLKRKKINFLQEMLDARTINFSHSIAPAHGLYLLQVDY